MSGAVGARVRASAGTRSEVAVVGTTGKPGGAPVERTQKPSPARPPWPGIRRPGRRAARISDAEPSQERGFLKRPANLRARRSAPRFLVLSVNNDGAKALPRMQRVERVIRVLDSVELVRDVLIDWELTVKVALDELRDLGA